MNAITIYYRQYSLPTDTADIIHETKQRIANQ